MIEITAITGIYKITNKITGEFYIGASVNIRGRFSNHMNRDARNYKGKHRFYDEVLSYGKENFELTILKECDRVDLLKYEQYYYDKLKPTYNKVRPEENNFIHKEVQEKATKNSNTPEIIAKRKETYNTPEYKKLFREMHVGQMRPVLMIKDGNVINEFISLQEASRFITDTTDFKGKNKTSKIKAVCDGERLSAYGYQWEYKKL